MGWTTKYDILNIHEYTDFATIHPDLSRHRSRPQRASKARCRRDSYCLQSRFSACCGLPRDEIENETTPARNIQYIDNAIWCVYVYDYVYIVYNVIKCECIYIYIPVSSSCCIFSAVLEKTWLRSQTAGKSAFEHFSHFSRLEKKCKNETAQIGAKTAQNDAKTAQNSGNHQKRMIFLKTTCFLPNCKNYCSFGKQHFFRAPGWYRYDLSPRE